MHAAVAMHAAGGHHHGRIHATGGHHHGRINAAGHRRHGVIAHGRHGLQRQRPLRRLGRLRFGRCLDPSLDAVISLISRLELGLRLGQLML